MTHEQPFRDVYDAYYPFILKRFMSKGFDLEKSRDLTQETFVKAYSGWDGFQGKAPVKAWLYTIADNVFKNRLRYLSSQKRDRVEIGLEEVQALDEGEGSRDRLEDETPGDVSPLDALHEKDNAQILQQAVQQLSGKRKACLCFRYYQDMKYQDIADTLGISLDAVKANLAQARKQLRELLKDQLPHLQL